MRRKFAAADGRICGAIAAVLLAGATGGGSLALVTVQASSAAHVTRAVQAASNCSPRCKACLGVCG